MSYGNETYGDGANHPPPYNGNYELSNVNPYASNNDGANAPADDMVAFFAEVDDIKKNLAQFEDNIDRIENLHKRSLTEVAGEDEQWTQNQLDEISQETRALSENLKSRIKTLESRSQRDSTKKTQAENVKRQFMAAIQKYQTTEATFRQRYREVAERQYRIVRPEATDAEVREAIDDAQGQQIFSQALLSSNRRGQARSALTEVQTRHREIQKIEQTMTELGQLFHDMEILVAEQEEPVRHIDEQATQVQGDIEQGVAHTGRAIISARAARKKKWWCLGICVIIAIILALVLGIHFGNS